MDFLVFENRDILVDGVTQINKEKKKRFLLGAILWGLLYVVILLFFVGAHNQKTAGEIKRFYGTKPSFEKYEDYIMSDFFTVSYETDTSLIDPSTIDFTDKSAMISMAFSMGTTRNVIQRGDPEHYDFAGLDLRKIDDRRSAINMSYSLPKETKTYKDVAARAKALFDEEMSKRAAEARKISIKETLVSVFFVILYVVVMLFFGSRVVKTCENKISEIRQGKCKVTKGTLIGRERVSRYRSSNLYYVEVETEDHNRETINVKSMHYDCFESNKPCYLIKYKDEYGAYDTMDVVWDGLHCS